MNNNGFLNYIQQNKKQVTVIAGCIIVVIVVVIALTQFFVGNHKVFVDLSDEISSANIFFRGMNGEPANKVTTINTDSYVSFKNGEYLAIVDGENVDSSVYIEFNITSDTRSVDILPTFNKKHLEEMLTETISNSESASREELYEKIYTSFGNLDSINIAKGELISDGSWFVGIVTSKNITPRTKFDQYKIILHDAGNGWYVAAPQAFVFRYDDFPEVPRSVIKFANEYEV